MSSTIILNNKENNLYGRYNENEIGINHMDFITSLNYTDDLQLIKIEYDAKEAQPNFEELQYIYNYYIVKEGKKEGLIRLAQPNKKFINILGTENKISVILPIMNQSLKVIAFRKGNAIIEVRNFETNKYGFFNIEKNRFIYERENGMIEKPRRLIKII